MEGALNLLERAELVRDTHALDPEYIFKHVLVQDTVYAALLKPDRRELHRQVAAVLEAECHGNIDEIAARLAQHYAEAGDDAKTLEYAARAGDAAARVHAHDEALAGYALALDAAERLAANPAFDWSAAVTPLYTRRGRVLEVIGRYSEAVAAYDEFGAQARARGSREGELAALMLSAASSAAPTLMFDAARAQAQLDAALQLARALDDRAAQARILWNLTLLSIHTSHTKAAVAYGQESLALTRALLAEGKDVREQLAYSLHELYLPYRMTGQIERAAEVQAQSLAMWRELDNKPMLADALGMGAQFASPEGNFERAIAFATEGAAISRTIGNYFGVMFNTAMLMEAARHQGEVRRILELHEQLDPFFSQVNLGVVGLLCYEAFLLTQLGAFERGASAERQARGALNSPMPSHFVSRAYAVLTRLDILRGDLTSAAADLEASTREVNMGDMESHAMPEIFLAVADLALAQHDPARALVQMDDALRATLQLQFYGLMPQQLYFKARALFDLGRDAEARAALREAEEIAAPRAMRPVLWQIHALRAELEERQGDSESAATHRELARRYIQEIGARSPDDLRASFFALPAIKRLL